MDALILSCGTGGGHDSAAKAVVRELQIRGHRTAMLNPYILQSEALARRINNMYIAMVRKTPRLFGAVYTAGLSSTEAAVCGVPILHTAAIPCCERYNAAYFSAHGMSSLCRVPSEIVACAMAILSNPEKCVAMVERQYAMLDGAAAARICRFAETMTLK